MTERRLVQITRLAPASVTPAQATRAVTPAQAGAQSVVGGASADDGTSPVIPINGATKDLKEDGVDYGLDPRLRGDDEGGPGGGPRDHGLGPRLRGDDGRGDGDDGRGDEDDGGSGEDHGGMRDGFGRRVEYLRISVTDKCNLRCVYCMPEEGLPWLKREEILSYEEITEIVRAMAGMGLRRLRITGGEPLVRRDLPRLIGQLRTVPGIDDIALSTNAVLLDEQARALRDAGVSRLNVSLDSLIPERIDAISRRPGTAARIFRGLEVAEEVGFAPLKINCVVMRGRNDDEVEAFARITRERPWHVRFIEVMPTGENLGVSRDEYVSSDEILQRIAAIGELSPVEGPRGNGPATYFAFPDAAGTIGVITPMSHNYCDRCNRMRLTADGQLRPCLFGALQTNLRDPLRVGSPIEPLVRQTLHIKPERHWLVQGSEQGSGGLLALSQVGG